MTVEQASPQTHNSSIWVPEKHSPERRLALLVFLFTCAYLFLFRRNTAMDPVEGIILQGAQRILHGEVLYRDFFSFVTPGPYYFLAFFFKVFGSSILVGRTALVFIGGIFTAVTYLLARRVCARWEMENRIKEQRMLFSDRTSTEFLRNNQLRLYFSSVAYLLLHALWRLELQGTELAQAQSATIRLKLLKIGALIRITARKGWVSLASGYPYQDLFRQVYAQLQAAPRCR